MARDWKVELWGCCSNPKMCLFSLCVPLGPVCMQALNSKRTQKDRKACAIACLCALCCGCIGSTYNRFKLRQAFEIKGNAGYDCLVHWCIPWCAVTQEWKEVVLEVYGDERRSICNK